MNTKLGSVALLLFVAFSAGSTVGCALPAPGFRGAPISAASGASVGGGDASSSPVRARREPATTRVARSERALTDRDVLRTSPDERRLRVFHECWRCTR